MVAAYTEPTSYDDAMSPPFDLKKQLGYGAQAPKWYKKPKKPDLADVLEAAEQERTDHQPRVDQGYRMLRRINDKTTAAFFHRLRAKVASGEVEQVWLPGLRDETDLAVGFAAQMDWVPQALYRSSLDKEMAAAKEDLCVYLMENAQRQYSRSGGADLKAAKAFNLWVFGCVAEFVGLDVDNEECGLRMRLLDPQTLFPVWEGERGLSCVYSKYQTTASEFIGTFGNMDDFDEDPVRATAEGGGSRYDPHYLGEVVEYWDRNWGFVAWDDKEVLCFEHEYAEVPIEITVGNFGQTMNISTPDMSNTLHGSYFGNDRSEDLKRIYQPYLERRVPQHEVEESIAGLLATMMRKSQNPSRTVKAGVLTYEDEAPHFSTDEGHTNMLRDTDEAEIDVIGIDPQVGAAWFTIMQQAKATSTPSSVIAGQAPMSQGSGTALNVLARNGTERWALYIKALQHHETNVTEKRLRQLRDFGPLLGMDGTIYVPRRGRPNVRTGNSPAHEVTSETLKETGIRVNVEFRRFNPSELPSMVQAVGMAISTGVMPKRNAIEILGYSEDVDAVLRELKSEMLSSVPEVAQVEMLDELIEEIEEAAWRGDDEAVEDRMNKAAYVASRVDIEQNTREAEQAQSAQMVAMAQTMQPGMMGMTGEMQEPTGSGGGRPSGGGMQAPPGVAGPPPVGGGD